MTPKAILAEYEVKKAELEEQLKRLYEEYNPRYIEAVKACPHKRVEYIPGDPHEGGYYRCLDCRTREGRRHWPTSAPDLEGRYFRVERSPRR